MKKIPLILRITTPSILCVVCLYFLISDLFYYPLTFGLIIGLFNWNIHRHKPIFGIIISVLVSYTAFIIAYISLGVTSKIFDFLSDLGNIIAIIISAFILAPLLVFFVYKFVFYIPKTKLTTYIIIFSVVLMVLQAYFLLNYDDSILTDTVRFKILNPFNIWQIVMALALQLLVNQKEYEKVSK